MNDKTKRTVRLALILGFIIGVMIGIGLISLFQKAEAHVFPYEEPIVWTEFLHLYHLSYHILEEEQKQTAILDWQSCVLVYKPSKGYLGVHIEWVGHVSARTSIDLIGYCGDYPGNVKALNITGIWNP